MGNLYDPFGFNKNASPEKKAKGLRAEINNGRLAMLGIFGILSASKIPGSVPGLATIDIKPYAGEYMGPFVAGDVTCSTWRPSSPSKQACRQAVTGPVRVAWVRETHSAPNQPEGGVSPALQGVSPRIQGVKHLLCKILDCMCVIACVKACGMSGIKSTIKKRK